MDTGWPQPATDRTDAEGTLWTRAPPLQHEQGGPRKGRGWRTERNPAVGLAVPGRRGHRRVRHSAQTSLLVPTDAYRPLLEEVLALCGYQELSGRSAQTVGPQPAGQISVSCRHVSSCGQPACLPRRRLKLTSVFRTQGRRRW